MQELLCELGRRIWQQGLSPGTGGNISARVDNDRMLISPTLTSLGFMEPGDLCLCDLDGNVLACETKPSSEYKMHLHVYNMRPEINGVIHAHPPFASAFAVTGEPLNTFIQPETVVFLRRVPLVEYGTPSTDELPLKLDEPLAKGLDTFLLQNHGVLCIGSDMLRTYYNLETLENLAKVTVISRMIGKEQDISQENLAKLSRIFGVDLDL